MSQALFLFNSYHNSVRLVCFKSFYLHSGLWKAYNIEKQICLAIKEQLACQSDAHGWSAIYIKEFVGFRLCSSNLQSSTNHFEQGIL